VHGDADRESHRGGYREQRTSPQRTHRISKVLDHHQSPWSPPASLISNRQRERRQACRNRNHECRFRTPEPTQLVRSNPSLTPVLSSRDASTKTVPLTPVRTTLRRRFAHSARGRRQPG